MTSLLVGRYTRVYSPHLKASAYKLSVVHDLLPLIYLIAIQLTITKKSEDKFYKTKNKL